MTKAREIAEEIAAGFAEMWTPPTFVSDLEATVAKHLEGEWVKVSERLPELKEIYTGGPKNWRGLVYNGSNITAGYLEETYVNRKLSWKNSTGVCIRVTHWKEFGPSPDEETRIDG